VDSELAADLEWNRLAIRAAGDGHRRVRISDVQVAEIRRLCAEGIRQAEVARMFDMPRTNVSAILKGKYRKRAWVPR
jgi:hypothetical protein